MNWPQFAFGMLAGAGCVITGMVISNVINWLIKLSSDAGALNRKR